MKSIFYIIIYIKKTYKTLHKKTQFIYSKTPKTHHFYSNLYQNTLKYNNLLNLLLLKFSISTNRLKTEKKPAFAGFCHLISLILYGVVW